MKLLKAHIKIKAISSKKIGFSKRKFTSLLFHLFLKSIFSQTRKPKIVIIGAGAMGSFISAKLAAKDFADVWMVSSWKEQVERINKTGLNLINLDGKPDSIRSVRATCDALDVIKDGYPDLCLIMVKSHSTKQVCIL